MKYVVQYDKPKKKGTATQRATFFDIRDAMMWESTSGTKPTVKT